MEEKIIEQIKNYAPFNRQENMDKKLILELSKQENIFVRENARAHFTASAWVVNKDFTKVLMAYHNIYNSWAWLGGHADGETDLLQAALREVREESGVSWVRPVTEEIFSLEVLTVDGHIKRGRYVSSHLHLNVTYLLTADESRPLAVRPEENSAVAWLELDEAMEKVSEEWMKENIYKKLIKKAEFFKKRGGKRKVDSVTPKIGGF